MKSDAPQPDKPLIIPIFIMNRGCPGHCLFCNQKISAGRFDPQITKSFFDTEVTNYLQWNKDKRRRVEIAFYGGSFTGLALDDQNRLLSWAGAYLRSGQVQSLRISTRPDGIDEDRLQYLKASGVGAVELGAQSFNNEVLRLSQRGHDAEATVRAMQMLQSHEIQTGLHLMAGLPGDSRESFFQSLEQTVQLHPDTVRIHPVLVFADTPLADEYRLGRYEPLSLSDAVSYGLLAWETLAPAGIRIIRLGLHLTPEMNREGAIVAGPVHPAFGALVYSAVYHSCILQLLAHLPGPTRELRFAVDQRDLSNFRGYKNSNMDAIKKLYPGTHIIVNSVTREHQGRITLSTDTGDTFSQTIPGISSITGVARV